MNNDRKSTIFQKQIDELEKEINILKRENLYLKQLMPNTAKVEEVQNLIFKYQAEFDELAKIKKKYRDALREIQALKKSYKAKVDKLLKRIRHQ